MASKDVKTKIIVEADTRQATGALEGIESAAGDAEAAVRAVSDTGVEVDTTAAVGDLEKIETASDGAVSALKSIGDTGVTVDTSKALSDVDQLAAQARALTRDPYRIAVDVDVDRAKLAGAANDVKSLGVNAEGIQRGIGPLRGFTDELGGTSAAAGTAAAALVDAGEAVEIFGAQLGLSEKTLGRISLGLGAVGLAVGAATLAWGKYQEGQKKAAETAKALYEIQELLGDQKYEEAAESLAGRYGELFDALEAQGIPAGDAAAYLTGQLEQLPPVTGRFAGGLVTLEAAAKGAREELKASGVEYAASKTRIDGITTALGGTVDATGKVATAVGDLPAAITPAHAAFLELGPAAESSFNFAIEGAEGAVEAIDRIPEALRRAGDENSYFDILDQFDNVKEKAEAAYIAAATGAEDAETKNREYQRAVNDLELATYDYLTQVLEIPAERATVITALIEQGSIDSARAIIDDLTKPQTVYFTPVYQGGGRPVIAPPPVVGPPGTPLQYGTAAVPLIGTVTVNMPRTADGQDVIDAVSDWTRLDGRQP
jgi:hypothetical protein